MDVATLALGLYMTVITSALGWLVVRRLDQLPTREEMNARFDAHDKRFDAHGKRLERLEGETAAVRAETSALRAETSALRADTSELRVESAAMRSDLTHIALAVGARPRPQTG